MAKSSQLVQGNDGKHQELKAVAKAIFEATRLPVVIR